MRLLGSLAGVLAGTGQFASSRAALLELLELVPADAAGVRVKLVAACAGVEHLMGRHADAQTRLASALDHVPDQSSPDAAALMIDLATDAFFGADWGRMRAWRCGPI
jgi:hypothetical protein